MLPQVKPLIRPLATQSLSLIVGSHQIVTFTRRKALSDQEVWVTRNPCRKHAKGPVNPSYIGCDNA